MYKYLLENAGDLSLMALIPLVLFTVIFVGAMIRTMTRNKGHIEHMARLPLDDSSSELIETE